MKTILVDAVGSIVNSDGDLFDEMYQMLEEFPDRKIILTNADYQSTNKYNLNNMPYEVFTLAHNPDKTDPAYYQKMLSHFDLSADNVVYFEHSQDAVQSAKSVGITTFWYDKEKKDLDILQEFLSKNL